MPSQKSPAANPRFWVFPVHLESQEGRARIRRFTGPLFAVDSRSYQVIRPDQQRLTEMGPGCLAIEKERPHVPLRGRSWPSVSPNT